jgi:proteic killer suppression protein
MYGVALHNPMIKTFRSKALKLFFEKGDASKLPVQNPSRIRRMLALLDVSTKPEDMNIPGSRFHGLNTKPKRYATDASGNYRMTFGFEDEDAVDVDLEDYH